MAPRSGLRQLLDKLRKLADGPLHIAAQLVGQLEVEDRLVLGLGTREVAALPSNHPQRDSRSSIIGCQSASAFERCDRTGDIADLVPNHPEVVPCGRVIVAR